jgi:orotate phosphoribosyltransferase
MCRNDQSTAIGETQNKMHHQAMANDGLMRIRKLRDTINDKCIVRVPNGSKELPSLGGQGYYGWQFYLRRVLLDPHCLQLICEDFWNRFEQPFDLEPFQLAGVESAAVPLITALVIDGARRGLDLSAFTIRKNRKTYGLRNLIEGSPSGRPILFVDDLTSPQHNAFWHAIHAISQSGLKLNGHGYVLVRKQNAEACPVIETSLGRVKIDSLFTLSDFSMTLEEYARESSGRLS